MELQVNLWPLLITFFLTIVVTALLVQGLNLLYNHVLWPKPLWNRRVYAVRQDNEFLSYQWKLYKQYLRKKLPWPGGAPHGWEMHRDDVVTGFFFPGGRHLLCCPEIISSHSGVHRRIPFTMQYVNDASTPEPGVMLVPERPLTSFDGQIRLFVFYDMEHTSNVVIQIAVVFPEEGVEEESATHVSHHAN